MSAVSTRRPAVSVCWEDRRRLLSEVCAEVGADFDLVHGRLLNGWHLERAIFAQPGAPKVGPEPEPVWADASAMSPASAVTWIEWEGQRRRLADVCFDHRLTPALVRRRMQHGWTLADALAAPKRICHKVSDAAA
jgi:hypothetical protein